MAQTRCLHCQEAMEPGHFGACLLLDGRLYSGHYDCVLEALGPKAALAAIRSGLLPNIADDAIVDKRLKKFVGRQRNRTAVGDQIRHGDGSPIAIRAVS